MLRFCLVAVGVLIATVSTPNVWANSPPTTITLPLPDGTSTQVIAEPVDILTPAVAARHPDIRAWRVTGVDGKTVDGQLDVTATGLHATLNMQNDDTLFIEPTTKAAHAYRSFSKRANPALFQHQWHCATHDDTVDTATTHTPPVYAAARQFAAKSASEIHQYRLAIAATGEYTAFHGGKQAAFAAIVTTVNRLNAIYEREAGIRFVLASDENVIFSDANTDPYDEQDVPQSMASNQTVLDTIIGNANYDVGQVFSTASGSVSGIARLSSVCDNTSKGMAVSGLALPDANSSAYYVDIVAHELGHQFSATHTFNSVLGNCATNRSAATAYEVGSGSTIMSYSGLCDTDNVQTNSHDFFHIASLNQIQAFAHTAGTIADACATKLTRNNNAPEVDAGNNYTIPAATAFTLRGTASDTDNDALRYSWEQIDSGAAANVTEDTGNNPLMKVLALTNSPVQTFPDLPTFLRVGYQRGQMLPSTTRSMKFALIARDGKGGVDYNTMQINVVDTGSRFTITQPTTTNLAAGDVNVQWNVANTNQAPINCAAVDIAYTHDGTSFNDLLTNTPNDGAADITLPANISGKTYIRVQCSDNIFFALSGVNFPVATANLKDDPTPDETNLNTGNTAAIPPTTNNSGAGSMPLSLCWIAMFALYRRWYKAK